MSSDCSFLRVSVSRVYRLLLESLLVGFLSLDLCEFGDFLLLEDFALFFHDLDLFFLEHFHPGLFEGFGDEHGEDGFDLDVEVEEVVLSDDLSADVDEVGVSGLLPPADGGLVEEQVCLCFALFHVWLVCEVLDDRHGGAGDRSHLGAVDEVTAPLFDTAVTGRGVFLLTRGYCAGDRRQLGQPVSVRERSGGFGA